MATNFKQVVHQNLECPVCLSFFKDPKILSCSHTFCRGCLESLLDSHLDNEKLPCPVCREATPVPGGDVSRLQANIAVRSMVEDVETQGQVCANCDHKSAVAYCCDCGTYFCESCRNTHSKWSVFAGHDVVPASDITSGKVPVKRRSRCQKHPNEYEECFCIDCGTYVCFRCGTLEHTNKGHTIVEAAVHENDRRKIIEELLSKATAKVCSVDDYVALVLEGRDKLRGKRERLTNEIDKACEEAVRKINERKELLKQEVDQLVGASENSLADMEEAGHQQIAQINAVCGLVKNGLKIPLQKDALATHKTLIEELGHLIENVEHDEEKPRKATEEGDRIFFQKRHYLEGLELGKVRRVELAKWTLRAEVDLPTKNSMNALTVSPNNTVSVASLLGGIVSYSADGTQLGTFLQHVKIRRLQCTSDGRYIVRDTDNNISLYTPQCRETICEKFETLSHEKGGFGDLTIDIDGHIITSYKKTKKIQVFKPTGGQAILDIPCDGFEPCQIFAMNHSKRIAVWDGFHTVHVIDGLSGAILHSVTKDGEYPHPAVCKDDSVIIAWVETTEGRVSIEQYTSDLQYTKNILTDFKISNQSRNWYFLQQFVSGEIAFCTPDRLYIFHETGESGETGFRIFH